MGTYAKVVDGKVTEVIKATANFFKPKSEGGDGYVDNSPGQWIKTSYNTRGGVYYTPDTNDVDPDQSQALRGNYAGKDYTYDAEKDVFIAPQPFASWTLSADYLWEAPVAMPTDGKPYVWNEATGAWDEVVAE